MMIFLEICTYKMRKPSFFAPEAVSNEKDTLNSKSLYNLRVIHFFKLVHYDI